MIIGYSNKNVDESQWRCPTRNWKLSQKQDVYGLFSWHWNCLPGSRRYKMKKIISLIISLVLLAPLAFTYDDGNDPDQGVEPQYYDDARVMRVKYTQGEAYVKRSYDDGFEEAAINLPIFEKDTAGTTDGRLEVYMGRLNYLRLDNDTEVVFDKIPALQKTDLGVKVLRGGIYLDIENLDYERDIEIQTPDCGVFLLDKGTYRINVSEGGQSEVYVMDGIAEVAGDNYSRNVRENQKVVMFNGQVKERPFYFYSTDKDDFDRWNQDRTGELGYARYGSSQYLDSGYEEYEQELSRNGRWRYNDTYNSYTWIPYNVGDDWRPYYNGRWVWNPFYGYVWNSFDSWGYFTHHYGRWHWDPFYHWYWIPGYHWSPAWVSWFWDDDYYGWCPLSWWNRPVIVYNGHWWRDHHYRDGIPFNARSTTIIRKSQLSSPGVHRAALTNAETRILSKKSLVFKGNAPNERPTFSKVDVINARGKRVVYKENSLVSASKYKVMKSTTGISTTKNESPVYTYSGKKLTKEKVPQYTQSPYSKSKSSTIKEKAYKYGTDRESGGYKIKKYPSSSSSSGSESKTKSRSDSGSESDSSSSSGHRSKIKKSSSSSSSDSSGSSSSGKSSSSKTIKKKKSEPSYSYKSSASSSSYSYSSPYSSRSYSSKTYKKEPSSYSSSYKSPYKSRSPEKSYSTSNKSYRSSYSPSYKSSYTPSSRSSSNSYYKQPTRSSSSSSYHSRSSSSYPSYSRPSSSYKSYSTPSSSYRSSSSSRSYTHSTPSSSYRSSGSSSSSYSSSTRSSSSGSSHSSSSSGSIRKKGK
jgi:hypothetical protein